MSAQAAYQGFCFVSVTQVGVAVSTVVSLGLAPVLLTVAESVRHRRAPAPSRLAVLGAALVGLVLVSVAGPVTAAVVAAVVLSESLEAAAVVGILLALGAVAGLDRPAAAAGPVLPGPGRSTDHLTRRE